jgi:hypothetical protein
MYLRSLGDLTEIVQSQKHGLGSDDVETVAPLLPIAEGLLVFLFISGTLGLRYSTEKSNRIKHRLRAMTPTSPTASLFDLHPKVGVRGPEIQQISNRRAPKWDQKSLSETTRKAALSSEDRCLRW